MSLGEERALHGIARALGDGRRHREADRMLRAALRDHDDRDAFVAQRAEEPMRRARHADHARALEIEQRDRLDGRQSLHRLTPTTTARECACPDAPDLNVLRMKIGSARSTAGAIVLG